MRKQFAEEIHKQMSVNKDIWLLTGDLGFGMWDKVRDDFPDRFINTGAAEQALIGIAVGLALEGKIPVVYSITTFLIYRPFETIRNYIDHERIPVKLIGSGRDKDYEHDGFSHWSEDVGQLFSSNSFFRNIQVGYPDRIEDIPKLVKNILFYKKPYFISLRR